VTTSRYRGSESSDSDSDTSSNLPHGLAKRVTEERVEDERLHQHQHSCDDEGSETFDFEDANNDTSHLGGSMDCNIEANEDQSPSNYTRVSPYEGSEASESERSIHYHPPLLQRAPWSLITEVARRDLELEDDCNCYCSVNGCFPIHMISIMAGYGSIKTWVQIQNDIFDWISDSSATYQKSRKYVAAACRLEVFSRLGMAHTCCRRNTEFCVLTSRMIHGWNFRKKILTTRRS